MKFGVLVFPGSNCDRDVAWVTQGLLGQPTRMIWHEDTDLSDIDVVVIPGGFSYGAYKREDALIFFESGHRPLPPFNSYSVFFNSIVRSAMMCLSFMFSSLRRCSFRLCFSVSNTL